jgi:hypothetical protein
MSRNVLVVLSDPVPGLEDEYNQWYDEVHLPEVLALEGFTSAARFVVPGPSGLARPRLRQKYLAVYGISGDVADATASLRDAVRSGRIVLPACIDSDSICITPFSPV